MTTYSYEIRGCLSCGLRYPLSEGNSFGVRCPQCLGETKILLSRQTDNSVFPELYAKENQNKYFSVLLDNIRSAWNVGSILRSADGLGFSHAYLCGITPTPENAVVAKTALGAEDFVNWSYHKDALKLIQGLKKEGWKILALEMNTHAKEIAQFSTISQNSVLIVGNEVTGVDVELLDNADEIYYIPMYGQKKSFNVAVSFGIAGYALRNQQVKI